MPRRGVVLRVLLVLGVVAVTLAAATRWYLTSRHAADRVRDRLAEMLGVPVRVDSVDLGLGARSTLAGLRVFEAGGGGAEPFLTAAAVEADASAWSLSGGERPRNVTLTGAALTLRFDENGRLLSRLPRGGDPAELPRFVIRSGTVTLEHRGRPDLVVRGVEGEVRREGAVVLLEGTFNDPRWGKGSVEGHFDFVDGVLEGSLKTGVVRLTAHQLEGLPFAPDETWRQVRCDGATSAEIGLRLRTRDERPDAVHYRVDLHPRRTHVEVLAVGLSAEQAAGRVLIEDGVVRLEGVEGKVAGGTLRTDAVLDFRRPVRDLEFDLGVAKVDVLRLPGGWKPPPLLGGSLTGKAHLDVTVENGRANVRDFETREPVRLRIVRDDTGFHFELPKLFRP